MSSDRLALVVALGVATYLSTTQDAQSPGSGTPPAPAIASARAPLGPPPAPVPAQPIAVAPPAPQVPLSTVITLTTTVEQLTRRLGDLAAEVEQLNQWRITQEAVALRKVARPLARTPPETTGRLEPSTGAPPVKKPRKARPAPKDLPLEMRTDEAKAAPGDVLGIGEVTDSLMKRIDRIDE